jgi:hypothetical protein
MKRSPAPWTIAVAHVTTAATSAGSGGDPHVGEILTPLRRSNARRPTVVRVSAAAANERALWMRHVAGAETLTTPAMSSGHRPDPGPTDA